MASTRTYNHANRSRRRTYYWRPTLRNKGLKMHNPTKNHRQEKNKPLRKLILTGSLMAANQRQGQKTDKALAQNWEFLLQQCHEENLFSGQQARPRPTLYQQQHWSQRAASVLKTLAMADELSNAKLLPESVTDLLDEYEKHHCNVQGN